MGYQYDNNQLKSLTGSQTRSFQYDNRGNVTNNGRNNFYFNLAQRLETSDFSAYVYDGHGRRVKKQAKDGSSTDYSLYNQAGKLLYREKDSQAIKYVYLGNQQVVRIDNNTQYVHTDLLGSPIVETDSNGNPIANTRLHYRPFGATIEQPKDDIGYTGHKFDTDIKLSYMQQRYYDPEIGRFMSNDPIGFRDVHSFNRYTYANNNPYKYIDPDGQATESYLNRPKGVTIAQHRAAMSQAGSVATTIASRTPAGIALRVIAEVAIVMSESNNESTDESSAESKVDDTVKDLDEKSKPDQKKGKTKKAKV